MDVYGMLFSNPVLPFEDLTRLLTREHRVEKNGRVRDLLLTYHASRNLAGEIDAIDVGIEDVTELRQLELANTALHYEQAVLGRIYSDPESFVEVLELMTDVLDDCQELLVRLDELNSDATAIAIETCIRSVHSLKGLSSVFGFEPVQQCCDQIVSMVRRLKSQWGDASHLNARSVIPDFKKQLKDSLNLLHDQQEHARGLQDKIGNDLLKRLKGVVLPETEFETLRACLKSGKIHEAIRIIDSAQERDALELFNNWDVKVDLMARTLKKVVRFERKGAGGAIPKDLFFALSNVLINVMNNSLDHGIERPDERLALGKPREGYLLAQAVVHTGFLELEVSDDGQGIDFAQLPALAKSLPELDMDEITAIESSGELWRILLLPGFTTAAMVTRYSGYGEGLSFLNLIVLAQQGTVRVESRVGHGLTVSLRIPLNAT
jgi:chemotaxis protein histidine kinase CheA